PEPTAPEPTAPMPPAAAAPETVTAIATGFNAFGLDLYRKVASTPGDQVISPASVALALCMTHAGAKGPSAAEIERALGFGSYPVAEVQSAVGTMLAAYAAPPEGVELAVANRLFGEAKVAFHEPFLERTKSVFAAPLQTMDFRGAPEPSRAEINGWVEQQTRERIQDLLPAGSVDDTTRLVLVNAIYFKSQWMSPFPEHRTAPAPFSAPGGPHDVPTMTVTEHFRIARLPSEGVSLIELPYADPAFAMTVVVPTAVDGLAALEAALTPETLDRWMGALTGERVALSLPKFRIAPAESLRLQPVLGELGIRTLFTAEADLTGIAPPREQLQLSEVFHKGFIAVDEKGTEAAAATAVLARAGGMPSEPTVLAVDRPFLYLVRDTKTGLVLFLGRVVDPKTEG
ncbi:serpin family protein, partial [Paraliomyxa miuraensis]|uniref:serpin family protein n=1 Tax=Paraliomyxa miuraensis TaxID=376150 RepID=UPI002257038B